MSEGGGFKQTRALSVFITVVVIAVVLFVGYQVIMAVSPPDELETHFEKSQEWCEQHNGKLINEQTIGEHGGLHCDIPNGPSVHMDDVAEQNYTHNWTIIEEQVVSPYQDQSWYMLGAMPLLLAAIGIGAVVQAASLAFWVKDHDGE